MKLHLSRRLFVFMALIFLCLGSVGFLKETMALWGPAQVEQLEILPAPWCHSLSVLTDRIHKALPALLTKQKTHFSISTGLFSSCQGKSNFIYNTEVGSNQCINVNGQNPSLDLTTLQSTFDHLQREQHRFYENRRHTGPSFRFSSRGEVLNNP